MPDPQLRPNPTLWKVWLREVVAVWSGGWSRLWPRMWMVIAACLVGAILVLTVGKTDVLLQQKAQVDHNPNAHALARVLSSRSDLNFAVPLSIGIWVCGAAIGRVRLRKLGLACLMATLLGGLIVLVFRMGTGRPRPNIAQPYTTLADGFYGPHWDNDYRSFPSGHATTSSATAASLAGAIPVLTVPGVVYAVAVSWSRLQLDKHHPIDVTVGATVGTLTGLCFAGGVPGARIRLRRRRRKRVALQRRDAVEQEETEGTEI